MGQPASSACLTSLTIALPADPNKFQAIPFHLRALKYLLAQLQNAETADNEAAKMAGNADDVEQDDGDDDWEEDDDLCKTEKQEMAMLSGKSGLKSSAPRSNIPSACRHTRRWWLRKME